MMRLHSLKGVAEHAPALHADLAFLGDDGAFHIGSGPKVVVHGAPRCLWISTIVGSTILSTHKTRRSSSELDIDQAVVVDCCLDGVECAILRELDGNAVSEEGLLLLVEAVVTEGVGCP